MQVVQNTPLWVWCLLAALVVLGARALKPRRIPLWQAAIAPVVFGAWGVVALATRSLQDPLLLGVWAAGALVGAAICLRLANFDEVSFDSGTRLLGIPGSPVPLIRNLTVFAVKYALTVAVVLRVADTRMLTFADVAVSGLIAGFFGLWLGRLLVRYRALDGAAVAGS